MVDESDGLDEALEGQLRVMLTAAGRIGEQFARVREQSRRNAEAQSLQEARELEARLIAERTTASAHLNNVYREEWWAGATPDHVAHHYQLARAWAREDQSADRAAKHIQSEVKTRYGIDLDSAASPEMLRAELHRAEQHQQQATEAARRAQQEQAEAATLLAAANAEDARADAAAAAAEFEADPAEREAAQLEVEAHTVRANADRSESKRVYDSAERRSADANELASKGFSNEAVAARMHSDVAQGKPATEAVAGNGGRSYSKARKQSLGRGTERQRNGMSR